jgi:hypothetical protein
VFPGWDKDSYTGSWLTLISCTCVLPLRLILFDPTFSLDPGHLFLLASVAFKVSALVSLQYFFSSYALLLWMFSPPNFYLFHKLFFLIKIDKLLFSCGRQILYPWAYTPNQPHSIFNENFSFSILLSSRWVWYSSRHFIHENKTHLPLPSTHTELVTEFYVQILKMFLLQ